MSSRVIEVDLLISARASHLHASALDPDLRGRGENGGREGEHAPSNVIGFLSAASSPPAPAPADDIVVAK